MSDFFYESEHLFFLIWNCIVVLFIFFSIENTLDESIKYMRGLIRNLFELMEENVLFSFPSLAFFKV